jgi:hypothetical protein
MAIIAIKKITSGTVPVDLTAKRAITPGAVALALLNKPTDIVPADPATATYAALGASGGFTTAIKTPGIQLAQNNALIPFLLSKAVISVAMDAGTYPVAAAYVSKIGAYRDVNGLTADDIEIGVQTAPSTFFSPSAKIASMFVASQLSLSNGNSSVVSYRTQNSQPGTVWPKVTTMDMFSNDVVAVSNSYKSINTIASLAGLPNVALAATLINSASAMISASVCEYYEVTIDDRYLQNQSTLLNDLFIIIPSTFGGVRCDLYNTDFAIAGASYQTVGTPGQTITTGQFVVPLSACANGAIPSQQRAEVIPGFITDAAGKYDISVNCVTAVALNSQPPLQLIGHVDPSTATAGPYP